MIEYISVSEGRARLYFSTREEKELFMRGIREMEGVKELEGKENTRTLLVVYSKGSFAEYFISQIKIRREAERLSREDIHFYLSHLIKHPALKLLFSMAMLGSVAGLITFGVCSMFLVPYVKTKL